MSTAAFPQAPPPAEVRRFTVTEYHQMIAGGIIGADERIELLEGWIVPKMPHTPQHRQTIVRLHTRILPCLQTGWYCQIQSPITTLDSEPEPDLAIIRGDVDTEGSRHPNASDIEMLAEVSLSSLADDRLWKLRLYARAGIRCYWIIDLVHRQVNVYTQPSGSIANPDYAQCQSYGENDSVPLTLGGQVVAHIPVAQLLPRQMP